ncbi:MAG: hypothetical protein MUP70_05270 [Candidatus Aminicenantes bacterium]|nr:hypothetical protein [Candidatus Aminicenantes bacterium]
MMAGEDCIYLFLAVFKDGTLMETTSDTELIGKGGTWIAKTGSFDMEPNHDYYAIGCFIALAPDGEIAGVIGIINSINWHV